MTLRVIWKMTLRVIWKMTLRVIWKMTLRVPRSAFLQKRALRFGVEREPAD